MKKVKIVVLLVILGLIALIGVQNRDFILVTQQFSINLLFFNYQSPEIPNFALLIAFFMAGLLLAYFSSLMERFRARRVIKDLTGQVNAGREKSEALEKELAGLKAIPKEPEAMDGGPDANP
jgi:uncharacterized integral membrane protein